MSWKHFCNLYVMEIQSLSSERMKLTLRIIVKEVELFVRLSSCRKEPAKRLIQNHKEEGQFFLISDVISLLKPSWMWTCPVLQRVWPSAQGPSLFNKEYEEEQVS